jgi:quercetin dioxygenase-like cupin family protein
MIVQSEKNVPSEDEVPGVRMKWMIGEKEGAPNFALRVLVVEAGAATPFHTHPWEHEVYIIEGHGYVRGQEKEIPFIMEDAVYIEPNEKHQFVNNGQDSLKFICVIPIVEQ